MPKNGQGRPRKDAPASGRGSRRSKTFGKKPDRVGRIGGKWREEFIGIVEYLVATEDLSDQEIMQILKIGKTQFYEWKRLIPEFRKAFKRGEKKQVETIEASMFKRATGYTQPIEKIFQYQGKIVRGNTEEVYPPDPAAAKLLLQGLAPEKYGDKLQLENSKTRPIAFIIEGLNPEPANPEKAKGQKKEAKSDRSRTRGAASP